MKSVLIISSVCALARAAAFDNSAEAASIAAAATTLNGEGNYQFTNVKTGQTLSFVRQGVTNFLPTDDSSGSLAVQFNSQNQARLSGGNNKCVSAQWTTEGRGYDFAAVSYACTVGTGLLTGTATLEKTKQWWYIVPADGGDDSGQANPDVGKVLLAQAKSKFTSDIADGPVKASSNNNSDDNDSDDNSDDAEDNKKPASVSAASYTTTKANVKSGSKYPEGVNPSDRSTWICKHDGAWVAAHPGYVDKHPECASDLAAFKSGKSRRSNRRQASHAQMAEKLRSKAKRDNTVVEKRGAASYYIIAVDHILDQSTKAFGSDAISSFGGYTSLALYEWNKGDSSQLWTISSA